MFGHSEVYIFGLKVTFFSWIFHSLLLQQFWARVVMRKWLNMEESDYSADPDDPEDPDSGDSDNEGE